MPSVTIPVITCVTVRSHGALDLTPLPVFSKSEPLPESGRMLSATRARLRPLARPIGKLPGMPLGTLGRMMIRAAALSVPAILMAAILVAVRHLRG